MSKLVIHEFLINATIIVGALMLSAMLRKVLNRYFRRSSWLINSDPTKFMFLKHVLSGLIYLAAIIVVIYRIPKLHSLAVSLTAGAGVLAIIVGFASQQAFSNIVGGIFIIIFRPFKVDDRITLSNGLAGIVEDINLRHTVIRNYENQRIVMPNSVIGNETIINSNMYEDVICKWVNFGISYDSDVDMAMAIMREEAEKHELCIDRRTEEDKAKGLNKVTVRVVSYGDSSVNLRAWAWAATPPDAFILGADLNYLVKKRFDEAGIEIPFPHRTITFKDKDMLEKVLKERS